ncbi:MULTISPECIES: phosphoribosylformylglycinamidine synthase subunit PurQ [unclassified Aureispira]|uniref:phosphoribosylformylglycinamidine synthase subunit PurQ n=1 Tax=unclassified Aureispira TaxID=2649989 RepID=UPI0006984A5F|nr:MULTISPECIES: phosphoribosylformylglycinamidine synthase subunit PurQ [unclassified Aureispira]WMX15444.1 phosphoribosylformylglycinamidine synthase subunit PurQ [Aureispira sp. CCB-E]
MTTVKSLVITGFGINCEEEMAAAYQLAGAIPEIVHLNEILLGQVSIHDYDILNFPGGFSFGDDLASGKVVSNKIKFKKLPSGNVLLDEIKQFLEDGKYILGVCNGFQMLVRMGLLPNTNHDFEPEATLSNNNSGKFEDRWVYCKVNSTTKTPFLKGITKIALPARHGEGKLIFMDDAMRAKVQAESLNCLTYCTEDGTETADYPANPNGADLNCAGLTNPTGQVFGLMPHPEAYLSLYNHPNWGQIKRNNPNHNEAGEGLTIFTNIVEHIKTKKLATV